MRSINAENCEGCELYEYNLDLEEENENLAEKNRELVQIVKEERAAKHGEWVASRVGASSSWFVECSKCHVVMPPVNYTYCPNCGADMRKKGGEDHETD